VHAVKVRPARREDREPLLGLRCALWPDRDLARHEREMRQRADAPARHETLLLEDADGRISGFAELTREHGAPGAEVRVSLEALFVAPTRRRQGGARMLLEAAERWAHSRGASALGCDVSATEHLALEALSWLGFGQPEHRVTLTRQVNVPLEVARPAPGEARAGAASLEPVLVMEPARGSTMLVVNVLLFAAAVASFAFTDIYARDMFRGVLLPLLDVGFVLYFLILFIVLRYRKRADSTARAERLFRGDP
jgi:aminoglycoside 6'-N-acetyltransferase I